MTITQQKDYEICLEHYIGVSGFLATCKILNITCCKKRFKASTFVVGLSPLRYGVNPVILRCYHFGRAGELGLGGRPAKKFNSSCNSFALSIIRWRSNFYPIYIRTDSPLHHIRQRLDQFGLTDVRKYILLLIQLLQFLGKYFCTSNRVHRILLPQKRGQIFDWPFL